MTNHRARWLARSSAIARHAQPSRWLPPPSAIPSQAPTAWLPPRGRHRSSEKFQRLNASQRRFKPVAVACHLTVALCAVTSAQAQEANQALDTVVVTGIRKSLDTTLNLKRTATGLGGRYRL